MNSLINGQHEQLQYVPALSIKFIQHMCYDSRVLSPARPNCNSIALAKEIVLDDCLVNFLFEGLKEAELTDRFACLWPFDESLASGAGSTDLHCTRIIIDSLTWRVI